MLWNGDVVHRLEHERREKEKGGRVLNSFKEV